MSILHDYTCGFCEHVFTVRIVLGRPANIRSRMEDSTPEDPAEFGPPDCPECGAEIDDCRILRDVEHLVSGDE
jgi:hypothetical protein